VYFNFIYKNEIYCNKIISLNKIKPKLLEAITKASVYIFFKINYKILIYIFIARGSPSLSHTSMVWISGLLKTLMSTKLVLPLKVKS
ncbi:hypothetical protein, partial [Staphylococcus pseudintermedius]|uniref:hypothetical protein n=1 Tax=Staphylococcus pseudintermedius TaxID=283734 RepID=UPI0028FD664F